MALTETTSTQASNLDGLTPSVADLNHLLGADGNGLAVADITKLAAMNASAADVNSISAKVASITVVAANGATDAADIVITALDGDGVAIANVVPLTVWISDLADGTAGSAHTHSTAPAFTVGEEVVEHITNDLWEVLTTAAGTCTLRCLDTAAELVTINASHGGIRGSDTLVTTDFVP